MINVVFLSNVAKLDKEHFTSYVFEIISFHFV